MFTITCTSENYMLLSKNNNLIENLWECNVNRFFSARILMNNFSVRLFNTQTLNHFLRRVPDHVCNPAVDFKQFRRDLNTYICSPGIWNVSALEVLRNRALQIDIYLLTYLLTYLLHWMINFVTQCHSFIHSFIHSFMHSFIHSFIHSFTHSFIHSFTHSFIHSLIHSFIHSFTHSLIHSLIHSCIHSFIHSFIHSLTHSFMHACIHSFIHSFVNVMIKYSNRLRLNDAG